jgi:SSS family solute:Na+ symporter
VLLWFASINFLHFAALLFVLSTVILVVVSYSTAPPPRERVADLTYKTAAVSPAADDDPSKRRVNIIASVLLAVIIGVLWIVFR